MLSAQRRPRRGSAVTPYELAVGSLRLTGAAMNRSRYRVERVAANVDRLICDQPDECGNQRRRRPHRAPGEAAMIARFTQEVPGGSPEGAGQHECDPEQHHDVY